MKTTFVTYTLIASIFSTGIMAGIFFTWTNAVTPGIGKLNDIAYLSAFQAMNRAILNPLFFAAFILPAVAIPLTALLSHGTTDKLPWLCIVLAALLYVAGCLCVTVFGNVPLNEQLDKLNVSDSVQDLHAFRNAFEAKWNLYHLVRTVATVISFLLLIIALV